MALFRAAVLLVAVTNDKLVVHVFAVFDLGFQSSLHTSPYINKSYRAIVPTQRRRKDFLIGGAQ